MKKIFSIMMIAIFLMGPLPESVRAEEKEEQSSTEAISQNEYGEYQLEWERKEGALFDTLLKVTRDGETVAEYEYNEDNNRIAKTSKGEAASFTYTSDFYLDTVSDKYGTIQYLYQFKDDSNIKYMTGFLYNGAEYEFVYEDGCITGIAGNGEEIAQYVYDSDYTFLTTMKKEGQEWIACEDEDFIGNINKIRFAQVYYDEETGWYYFGRYFDTKDNRYLDGINPNMCRAIDGVVSEQGLLSSYDAFLITNYNANSRSANYSAVETVCRVLYLEAGGVSYDWDAVAWVVYNRICNTSKTAYDEVTGGDFSAYDPNSSDFNFSLNSWYNTNKWETCYSNAERLMQKVAPLNTVSYINNQKNFRSIHTFISGYDADGSYQYFNGRKINNVAIPGTRQIPPSLLYSDLYYAYYNAHGNFNFYFSYEGE